jgi:hypothetical protein
MFEHEARIEFVRTRPEQLHRAWPTARPARCAVGELLIRVGRRLAAEPRPASAFAHEALPRC